MASFNFDMTNLLDTAASLFNGLWPLFAIVAGLSMAAGLLTLIVKQIREIFYGGLHYADPPTPSENELTRRDKHGIVRV
jgi:hypothetical protein